MKQILFILLLLTSATYAAKPSYEVFETWAPELGSSQTQLVNITVQRTGFVANSTNAHAFSNYFITQHDSIRWTNSSHLIQLSNNVVLAPNEQYTFTIPGTYTFESTTNASLNGQITVSELVYPSLKVTPVRPNGQFTMSATQTKVLDQPITTFQVTEQHTSQLLAQNYRFEILLEGGLNRTIQKDVVFKPSYTWKINDTVRHNYTTESGKSLFLGYINVSNTGNTDYTVDARVVGNASSFFTIPSTRLVFRNGQSSFPVQLDIPLATRTGTYTAQILVDNDHEEYKNEIEIMIKDITEPAIENISMGDAIVIQPNQVVIRASDNLGLRSGNFTINNKTITLTRDKDLFIGTYSVPELRQYLFSYCISDTELNRVCDTGTLNPSKYVIDMPSTVEFLRHKSGIYKRKPLFNINDTLSSPINITYTKLELEDNQTSVSVRLLKDGSVEHTFTINESFSVIEKGNYTIEVRTDRPTEYELSFQTKLPKEISGVTSFRVIGETVEYDILDKEELEAELPEGVSCDVIDTGEFETSKYQCITSIPVGTDADQIGVFMSRREKRLYDTQLNASLEQLDDQKKLSTYIGGGAIALLGFMLIFMLYMLQYHRYTYFLFGREK